MKAKMDVAIVGLGCAVLAVVLQTHAGEPDLALRVVLRELSCIRHGKTFDGKWLRRPENAQGRLAADFDAGIGP
jgi:hypothetical protein